MTASNECSANGRAVEAGMPPAPLEALADMLGMCTQPVGLRELENKRLRIRDKRMDTCTNEVCMHTYDKIPKGMHAYICSRLFNRGKSRRAAHENR